MDGDPLAGTEGSNHSSTRSIRAPKVLPVLIDMEDEATWFIKNLLVRVDLESPPPAESIIHVQTQVTPYYREMTTFNVWR